MYDSVEEDSGDPFIVVIGGGVRPVVIVIVIVVIVVRLTIVLIASSIEPRIAGFRDFVRIVAGFDPIIVRCKPT